MKTYKINVSELCNENKLEVLRKLVEAGYDKYYENWLPENLSECGYFIAYAPPSCINWNPISAWDDHHDIDELTFEQLRDLVVLNRNDVKDANYTYSGKPVLKLKTQDYKIWNNLDKCWAEHLGSQTDLRKGIKPIHPEPERVLISGVEAFIAKHDKKNVEWRLLGIDWQELTDREFMSWSVDRFVEGKYEFRIKPQTIKVELEIPVPFIPKDGEDCCYISDESVDGYHTVKYNSERYSGMMFGLYRPSDIDQVVAALHGALKCSS